MTILIATLAALPACRGRAVAGENDALRAQVISLEEQIMALERRNAELAAELKGASTVSDSLPEDVRAATPHPVEVKIGRLSHARDRDSDGVPDLLLIYLDPRDGLGRFTQLVGRLSVNAAVLPAGGDAVTIGRMEFDPIRVREAYRSGLTGTHYTFELPITVPPDSAEREAIVRVVYVDGLTNQTCSTERSVRLRN